MRTPSAKPPQVVEHWYALTIALVALTVALTLQGYARHEIGGASTRSSDHSAFAANLESAGPILDLSDTQYRSIDVPDRQIALTFDDGPDPEWTPKILDVLKRHNARATFFVMGSHVASYPGLTRRIVDEGHEIGNHTFTHVDLLRAKPWQARMELRLTDVALAAATGHQTRIMRPPYSSEANDIRTDTLEAWRQAVDGRHLVVLSTLDSNDWQKERSVDDIVASATPAGTEGGVVLMHDGGGDRRRTVAALDRLLDSLARRDFTTVTVGDIAHLPRADVMPAVTSSERMRDQALPLSLRVSNWVTSAFTIFAFAVAALALLRASVLVLFARRHARREEPDDPDFTPSVSVIVPAYNEEKGIAAAVRSLASSRYTSFEVVVVDDGSTDSTADIVRALVASEGLTNVALICQPNGGKAHALNAGIAKAAGDIIVTVDGDTVFSPDALAALVQPFRSADVGAVSGNTKVANRRGILGRWQHIEYVMGFNLDRRMYDRLGCMPTVPGAIGAFRASALRDVGGFGEDTLAEDTDVTMALHRAGWRVGYAPRAVAWTEAPLSMSDLWRQRYRWSYGTIQSTWKHRHAVVERGPAGRLGRRGLPYLVLFQVALPLLGPAVDVFTLYGLIFLDRDVFLLYWLGFTALQMAIAAYALRLDGESLKPVWTVPLQQFVYRQMMYLVVVQSLATASSGARLGWHKLRRRGDIESVSVST